MKWEDDVKQDLKGMHELSYKQEWIQTDHWAGQNSWRVVAPTEEEEEEVEEEEELFLLPVASAVYIFVGLLVWCVLARTLYPATSLISLRMDLI